MDLITWGKSNPMPLCNNHFLNDCEYCLCIRKKGIGWNVKVGFEVKRKCYVTEVNKKDKEDFTHPTIKPLHIIKNFILNSSKEGDVVLDCFMGSGTTGVACRELGRKFIGIEINEEYYKIAVDRINGITAKEREQKDKGQLSLFDMEE